MTATDAEARALIEQVFPPLPPATCTTCTTCTTGHLVAVAATGVAVGAALGVAAVMVTDAVLRRCIDALTVARARWDLDGLDGVLDGWQQEAGA